MNLVDVVAALAVLQYLHFAGLVGGARARYGVKAPAVTGGVELERIYRVQMAAAAEPSLTSRSVEELARRVEAPRTTLKWGGGFIVVAVLLARPR